MVTEFKISSSPLVGRNLIEASAGTGKTYAISLLFLRLVLELELGVDQILVVTFTVPATQELKDRIRIVLNDALNAFSQGGSDDAILDSIVKKNHGRSKRSMELLRDSINTLDQANIYTIHGFCQRVLRDKAFESKAFFDTELITDQSELVREVLNDFWRKKIATNLPEEMVAYIHNTLGRLPKVLAKALAYQDARVVIPCDYPSMDQVNKAVDEYRKVFKSLKEKWPVFREEVEDILRDPGLYRSVYGDGKRDKLIRAMDEYVASGGMALPLFKNFDKLTTDGIKCKKGSAPPRHEIFDLCGRVYQKALILADIAKEYELYLKGELIAYARRELRLMKQRLNVQYFDDLLSRVKEVLDSKEKGDLIQSIRNRYRAVLVDEFQDTDPVQYAIFDKLFNRDTILFLIGDPKQAIYSFRGADIFSYIKASKNVDNKYTLSKNWRSYSGLVDAINAIFMNADNPFVYQDITYSPVIAAGKSDPLRVEGDKGFALKLLFFKDDINNRTLTKEMAEKVVISSVAAEISRLLNLALAGKAHVGDRVLKPEDIAVLVSTNAQAREVRDRLKDLGIPSVIYSDLNVFDSHEASEISRILSAIASAGNENLVKAALATDIMGFNSQAIERVMEDERQWEDILLKFRDYRELWARDGFFRMFRTFLSKEEVSIKLLSLKSGERRLTNVLHLAELLHRASIENKLGVGGLLKWLCIQMDPSTVRLDENQIRLESDADAVKVATIHKSKGLEYHVVFCPFLWRLSRSIKEDLLMFHDQDMVLNIDLDADRSNPNRKIAEREILAENIRLMYVALTRAKSRCYLYWGLVRNSGNSPPAYLFHLRGAKCQFPQYEAEDMFKEMDVDAALDDLKDLEKKSNGSIQVSIVQAENKLSRYNPSGLEGQGLAYRMLSRHIRSDWKIASYTYLVSGEAREAISFDRETDIEEDVTGRTWSLKEESGETLDMFSFPRGAHPGICLHKIMECLDYSNNNRNHVEALVEKKLVEYGFDNRWVTPVCSMVDNVLNVPLEYAGGSLKLSMLNRGEWLNEVKFLFPIKMVNAKILGNVFGTYNHDDFARRLSSLGFKPSRGFMLGYMDMVFRFKGRFFLIDWKSDYLGDRIEDYRESKLGSVMENHYYVLQYHIYGLALHNYLKMKLDDYNYERHFGGIYYVFLRGVNPDYPGCGIFSARPSMEFIYQFGTALMEGKVPRVTG